MSSSTIISTEPVSTDSPDYSKLKIMVYFLFFIFGSITSLNDVLIPKLKHLFSLSYTEAMLVQSSFFFAYFIASIPAGLLIIKMGYMRAATMGLVTMATGCLLFIPATHVAQFYAFLSALFILAVGVTFIQVVANPLISMLGSTHSAHSRITFGHAFNSVGTTVAPYVGSLFILGSLSQVDSSTLSGDALKTFLAKEATVISNTYLGIAILLTAIAMIIWSFRKAIPPIQYSHSINPFSAFDLFKRPRYLFGFICLFLYVGAEVAIGSVLVSFLMQSSVFGFSAEVAGKHVAFYWGGAMVGRFIGAMMMRYVAPGKLLSCAAIAIILLITYATLSHGAAAGWSVLAIGFFNSIMFPTIFSLASEGLGKRAAEGSGLICCAIVGGAVIPPITGFTADISSLTLSLFVPAICYLGICLFGIFTTKARQYQPSAGDK
ncbi:MULTISPECIES: sugar MFS transporter [Sodalis]|uniref:FHS family L-fucose permease-like MFS transporter n=1 Tax=Sodalis ligni TaxID=2697027 RepID=A0A4R1NC27_9GAMM|nr:sugar MFS transporter [Sodalis ligni]TCL02106.1 FHS family L-fucose permease-like MFS transporter [Sodalis ligni]